MKRILYVLIYCFSIVSPQIQAQIEQVSVGPGYALDAFYNLTTGASSQVSNSSWDLFFSALGSTDAGIGYNEGVVNSQGLKLFLANTSQWTDTINMTETFTDSLQIFNQELTWSEGALNHVKTPGDPFDFGWGRYDLTDHQIKGERIFVVRKRNGSFIKLQITSLSGGAYHLRYANLDGSNEVSISLSKSLAGEAGVIFFSFETGEALPLNTRFDLMFTRYYTPLDDGEGGTLNYLVTGVLAGPKVKSVEVNGLDPKDADYGSFAGLLTDSLTVVGHDWKSFNLSTFAWSIREQLSYFIKTANDEVYQLVFLDFEGSSTGITTLEKTYVTTTSLTENKAVKNYWQISPNPVSSQFVITGDTQNPVRVAVIDQLGSKIWESTLDPNKACTLPENILNGVYYLMIQDKEKNQVIPFLVARQ